MRWWYGYEGKEADNFVLRKCCALSLETAKQCQFYQLG
jgi:hypothetical protein